MPNSSDAADLHEDQDLLHTLVMESGKIAMSFYGNDPSAWDKQDKSPVCEADLAVNQFLIEGLTRARPHYGYLSEESADDKSRLKRKRIWVIDPIDGTHAFLNGTPHWAISVALVENNRPILATVYNPVSNEFFHARTGSGAYLNQTRISVSHVPKVEHSRLLINPRVFQQTNWPAPWPQFHKQSRSSMAYRLSLVAAGIFDGAVALSHKSDWDLAAADLLVKEAGGRITDHQGSDLNYNTPTTRHPATICAGPCLHTALVKLTSPLTLPKRRDTPVTDRV